MIIGIASSILLCQFLCSHNLLQPRVPSSEMVYRSRFGIDGKFMERKRSPLKISSSTLKYVFRDMLVSRDAD